jgi:hypothetical protein
MTGNFEHDRICAASSRMIKKIVSQPLHNRHVFVRIITEVRVPVEKVVSGAHSISTITS